MELFEDINEFLTKCGYPKSLIDPTIIKLDSIDQSDIMNFLMKCQSHLINKSKSIIHNEINIKSKFLKRKRLDINQSNSLEFTTQNHCARTNPAPLNRKIQMKKNIIHNISNDLDRSTFQKFDNTKQMVHDERIINLESHLNLPIAKPVAISERIKRIEDRLIEIESQFPTFAAFYFDQESKNSNTTESHFFESKIQNPHSRVDSIQLTKSRDIESRIDEFKSLLEKSVPLG